MAVCAYSAGINLIALADLSHGRGKLASKTSYHRRIDLQSQTKVHQQNL
jgi:hypothetical protein